MSGSKRPCDGQALDIGADLSEPDAEAREALHGARKASGRLTPEQYLAFLQALPEASTEELRRRPVFRGEPFRL